MKTKSDPIQQSANRSRRWFRFSLRTLLILFAVVAALLHFWIIPSERQRRACDDLAKNHIFYRLEGGPIEGCMVGDFHDPLKVRWYHHYIYPVTAIYLTTDAWIPDWKAFPKLMHLRILSPHSWSDKILENDFLRDHIREIYFCHKIFGITGYTIDILSTYKYLNILDAENFFEIEADNNPFERLLKFENLKSLRLIVHRGESSPNFSEREQTFKKLRQKIPECNIRHITIKFSTEAS